MPDARIVAIAAGAFGLLLGSFRNVCTLRWPKNESVVSPPSHCGSCEARIRWFDNIPVLSWVLLRGRCRSCDVRISAQYPLVELATGLIWAGVFLRLGLEPEALRGAVFLTLLFGIALTDARFYIIPDQFSLGGLFLGLALAGWISYLGGTATPLIQAGAGAMLGFGLLLAVAIGGKALFKKDAMGGGDIKMMAMVGSFLGGAGVLLTLFLGALFGAVIFGPISMKTGKLVPFGIFLAAGAAVTFAWGDMILDWYFVNILEVTPG
jgi:leader peptidase (prepilin peptidase)/N-methyltransferase